MQGTIDEEKAEVEDTDDVDESFDLKRIGGNRQHYDKDWNVQDENPDQDNVPSNPSGKRLWTNSRLRESLEPMTVNGAKRMHWNYCKKELKQIKQRCYEVFGTKNPTATHIVRYFYGKESPLFNLFQNRLGWNHEKFLLFFATNTRLMSAKSSSACVYHEESPHDVKHLMLEEEFLQCWREVCSEGVPKEDEMPGNVSLFWEEIERTMNKLFRNLVIVGRSGKQLWLIDDDKIHYETKPQTNKVLNIKTLKHVRDNRWGFVLDTLLTQALMMVGDVRMHRRNSKQIDNLKNQVLGSAFGTDPLKVPDLTDMGLMFDRGYSFELSFLDILIPANLDTTCSSQRGKTFFLIMATTTNQMTQG